MRSRDMEAPGSMVEARTTLPHIYVDDSDPGIQYHGSWIHSPISDPENFNYAGSVTFSNTSGDTATYTFTGM
ncbi:hypothetical protein BD309DRAFT_964879 [Dichomitus squalens]|nr:hypothetical protein BD309DRAFT_964879 [Dichomitus squalens]